MIWHTQVKGIIEGEPVFTDEASHKISHLLSRIKVENLSNEVCPVISSPINVNIGCIGLVIYLTMPGDCVSKRGMSFYSHLKTGLDSFPDEYAVSYMVYRRKKILWEHLTLIIRKIGDILMCM